jgi:hypothetical protein
MLNCSPFQTAFRFLGIEQKQDAIFSMLAAILHLGNLKFCPSGVGEELKVENQDGTFETRCFVCLWCSEFSFVVLATVASLVRLNAQSLSKSLTFRRLVVRGTAVVIPLSLPEVKIVCECDKQMRKLLL